MSIYQTQGKYGGASKAVADLLNTMGSYEKMRRELKLQESFLRKASEGDKDFNTIIRELTEEQAKPQYSGGFAGAMQRLGGAFAPSGSPFMQQMAQGVMTSIAPVRKYAAQPWYRAPGVAGTPEAATAIKKEELEVKKAEKGLEETPTERYHRIQAETLDLMTPEERKQWMLKPTLDQKIDQLINEVRTGGTKGTVRPTQPQIKPPAKAEPPFTPPPLSKTLGLEEIWDDLTADERLTAIEAMRQGKSAEDIIQFFKSQK